MTQQKNKHDRYGGVIHNGCFRRAYGMNQWVIHSPWYFKGKNTRLQYNTVALSLHIEFTAGIKMGRTAWCFLMAGGCVVWTLFLSVVFLLIVLPRAACLVFGSARGGRGRRVLFQRPRLFFTASRRPRDVLLRYWRMCCDEAAVFKSCQAINILFPGIHTLCIDPYSLSFLLNWTLFRLHTIGPYTAHIDILLYDFE